mmetsp:Transcript_101787/g.172422  ORF Transcript_101787/g.172422 Transcript_101787/m.172422 type:complete len:476 (-) Transcript_101787:24-1451(-)
MLLRIWIESFDTELQLNVGGTNVAVKLLKLLLLLVDQVTKSQIQHAEELQVLLVNLQAEITKFLVSTVVAGLDGRASLGDGLLDQANHADRQIAVVNRQLQQLLVLGNNLQELLVLDLALLLAVVFFDAPLHLLEPLSAQLLQLSLKVLNLAPALVLLLDVVPQEPLGPVLCTRKTLHGLCVFQVGLLDGVVDVLQIGLAALLQTTLCILHLRSLLVGLLLRFVDFLEGSVLVFHRAGNTVLVVDQHNQTLLQLNLSVHLLLGNLHLTVTHGNVLDFICLLDLTKNSLDLLLSGGQGRLNVRHVHDVLSLLQGADWNLCQLGGIQLRAAKLLLDLFHLVDRVVDHSSERNDSGLVAVLLQLLQGLLQTDNIHKLRLVLGLVQLALRHFQAADSHQLRQIVSLGQVPLCPSLNSQQQLCGLLVSRSQLLLLGLRPITDVQFLNVLLILQAGGLQLQVVDLLLACSLQRNLSSVCHI